MAELNDDLPAESTGAAVDPRLEPLERAFAAGDYQELRRLAADLEREPELREQARAYRARTLVDPMQLVVLLGCLALFLLIAYKYVL